MICSHRRSTQLFIESINTEYPFYGHPCKSISDFDSNTENCFACSHRVCPEMGYRADKSSSRGKFYLRTREERPFSGKTEDICLFQCLPLCLDFIYSLAFIDIQYISTEYLILKLGRDLI